MCACELASVCACVCVHACVHACTLNYQSTSTKLNNFLWTTGFKEVYSNFVTDLCFFQAFTYCNFTKFWCIKISVASDHGAFSFV